MLSHIQANLLIVDDLPENLLALEALIKGADRQVYQAQSADEALSLLLEHEFALAILDVQMPGMNGFELAEMMRGTEKTKNNSFSPLYGTNHAHNGYMDYFYVGGRYENGVGLQDMYLYTKYDINNWDEITLELRSYIKQFIENGGTVLEENFVQETLVEETKKTEEFDNLDVTSQKIINILEEYVKPAVAADGGNIAFESFDEENKIVKVILQGACSGCPSSTFTLKSGIESLLKTMLNDDTIIVEAANA